VSINKECTISDIITGASFLLDGSKSTPLGTLIDNDHPWTLVSEVGRISIFITSFLVWVCVCGSIGVLWLVCLGLDSTVRLVVTKLSTVGALTAWKSLGVMVCASYAEWVASNISFLGVLARGSHLIGRDSWSSVGEILSLTLSFVGF
jgi:hypothetical protein